jgi:hypothetical protein
MEKFTSLDEYLDNEIKAEIKKSKKNTDLYINLPTENEYTIGFGRYLMKKILDKLDAKQFDYLYNTLLDDEVTLAIGKAFKSCNQSLR